MELVIPEVADGIELATLLVNPEGPEGKPDNAEPIPEYND